MERVDIKGLVLQSLKEVLAEDGTKAADAVDDSAHLIGSSSLLDSLGLVRLIVDVEQRLQAEYGLSLTLADERAMSQKHSPFRTVLALTDYVWGLAEEQRGHARA